MGKITAPTPIHADLDLSTFSCGKPLLDQWLQKRAIKNKKAGASRTYVVSKGRQIIAWYSIAAGAVIRINAPGTISRNMPDPIPVMVLGRLAVSIDFQGQGFGPALVRDAVKRTLIAADITGIRALMVHALDEAAFEFYQKIGFIPSPSQPLTLFLGIKGIRNALKT